MAFDVAATSPFQFTGLPPYQPSKVIAAGGERLPGSLDGGVNPVAEHHVRLRRTRPPCSSAAASWRITLDLLNITNGARIDDGADWTFGPVADIVTVTGSVLPTPDPGADLAVSTKPTSPSTSWTGPSRTRPSPRRSSTTTSDPGDLFVPPQPPRAGGTTCPTATWCTSSNQRGCIRTGPAPSAKARGAGPASFAGGDSQGRSGPGLGHLLFRWRDPVGDLLPGGTAEPGAGLYPKTRWIVGVSGGSYIAASLSLVRHGLRPSPIQRAPATAYERGSAEEQHLRDNTRYIAPDAKTVLVGALSLLLGVAVTFTLVMAPVYALSHVWGWLLRTQGILTWTRTGASASVTAWSWWLAPGRGAASR